MIECACYQNSSIKPVSPFSSIPETTSFALSHTISYIYPKSHLNHLIFPPPLEMDSTPHPRMPPAVASSSRVFATIELLEQILIYLIQPTKERAGTERQRLEHPLRWVRRPEVNMYLCTTPRHTRLDPLVHILSAQEVSHLWRATINGSARLQRFITSHTQSRLLRKSIAESRPPSSANKALWCRCFAEFIKTKTNARPRDKRICITLAPLVFCTRGILERILSFLPTQVISEAREVCIHWCNVVESSIPLMKAVYSFKHSPPWDWEYSKKLVSELKLTPEQLWDYKPEFEMEGCDDCCYWHCKDITKCRICWELHNDLN